MWSQLEGHSWVTLGPSLSHSSSHTLTTPKLTSPYTAAVAPTTTTPSRRDAQLILAVPVYRTQADRLPLVSLRQCSHRRYCFSTERRNAISSLRPSTGHNRCFTLTHTLSSTSMSLSHSTFPSSSPSRSAPSVPPASASTSPSHVHLPPLHGVTLPSSDAIPMTAPFTVPYTLPASTTPSAASTFTSTPPSAVRAPSDGMAAKMAAGGLSCMIISALLNPMDVVKIRLQTQNQLGSTATLAPSTTVSAFAPSSKPVFSSVSGTSGLTTHSASSTHRASPLHLSMYADSKYKGMTHGLLTIYREEGYARGLMRGSARSTRPTNSISLCNRMVPISCTVHCRFVLVSPPSVHLSISLVDVQCDAQLDA